MLRSPCLLAGVALVSLLLLTLNVVWLTVDRDVKVSSRTTNWSTVWTRLRSVAEVGSSRAGAEPCRPPDRTPIVETTATAVAVKTAVTKGPALLNVPKNTLLLGRPRAATGFLTIGIASVFRKEHYLSRTLRSLIDSSTAVERANVTVVVLLADTNDTLRSFRLKHLSSQFHGEVVDGFIQFIQPSPDLYPDLNFTSGRRRTFNDKPERVAWRTKQVIDFSFLFSYCCKLSEYYMILEDDILSTSRYITAIREFIQMHRHHDWVGLKFTQYMIIGDLVRSSSLPRLVQLMTMFREEQPVDFIMSHFISMMVNAPGLPTRRVPSLFNHIGRRSTLANKTQKVVDYHTNQVTRRFEHDNPPAEVVTNMRVVTGHLAPYAYSVAPGLFIGQPKRGSVGTLDVALTRRRRLRRVAVVTGQKQQYRLKRGRLLAATDLVRVTGTSAECTDWSLLGEFDSSGVVDVKAVDKLVPGGVQCVRVEVDRTHGGIVAITEITLFEES